MTGSDATRGGVIETIHPKDVMFQGSLPHYFSVGSDALKRIRAVMSTYGYAPKRILDFACGYGRVGRHLRHVYPNAELVSSDILKAGVAFCAETFGATPHYSDTDLTKVSFDRGFDLIWSGSLMTHLREDHAAQMFDLFVKSLNDNGTAIWTTHGRYLETLHRKGKWPYNLTPEAMTGIVETFKQGRYAYVDYAGVTNYGISITPLAWLAEQAARHDSIRIVSMIERGWDNHQDVVAIMKRAI